MVRYLLTGGAGFIGSNLTRYVLDKGCEVVVLDNFSTGKRENLAEIAERITLIEGDIRSATDVEKARIPKALYFPCQKPFPSKCG